MGAETSWGVKIDPAIPGAARAWGCIGGEHRGRHNSSLSQSRHRGGRAAGAEARPGPPTRTSKGPGWRVGQALAACPYKQPSRTSRADCGRPKEGPAWSRAVPEVDPAAVLG